MDKKGEKKGAEPDVEGIKQCVVQGQSDWAYDYFNQQLSKAKEREFEEHLFECDRCKDIILTLDWAYAEIRLNAHQYAGAPAKVAKKRPAVRAKSSKG